MAYWLLIEGRSFIDRNYNFLKSYTFGFLAFFHRKEVFPKQTKILKNAFKRTNGNRDCRPLTLIKKAHENAFIGVFCNFMSVKTVKIPVFER